MSRSRPIPRVLLREATKRRILESILAGNLHAGEPAREADIAAELRVSRTPVREALIALEHEGHLSRTRGSKTLHVPELSSREVEALYRFLGGIETLALRQYGLPSPYAVAELRDLAHKIFTGDATQYLRVERRWHELLLRRCRNDELSRVLANTRERAARYELAYLRGCGHLSPATLDQKTRIVEALRRDSIDDVCREIEATWDDRARAIVEWLTSRSLDHRVVGRNRIPSPT